MYRIKIVQQPFLPAPETLAIAVIVLASMLFFSGCTSHDESQATISEKQSSFPMPITITSANLTDLNTLLSVDVILAAQGADSIVLPLQISNIDQTEVRGSLPGIPVGDYNVSLLYKYNDPDFGPVELLVLTGKPVSIVEGEDTEVSFLNSSPNYTDSDFDGHANLKEIDTVFRSDPFKTLSVPGGGFYIPEHPTLEINTQTASFTLYWDNIEEAFEYDVIMNKRNEPPSTMTHPPISAPTTKFGHGNIEVGIMWDFSVGARSLNGIYEKYSPPTFVQMNLYDPTVPNKITITAGEGVNTISWEPVGGAVSYIIYYSTSLPIDKVTNEGMVASEFTGTTVTHANLTNGQMYYYVLTALSSNNSVLVESPESSIVGASPYGQLSPPVDLRIQAERQNEIDLAWSPVLGATKYYLYMSSLEGLEKEVIRKKIEQNVNDGSMIHSSTTEFYNHPGLNETTRYFFAIAAVDKYGRESILSNEVSGVPHAQ